MRIREKILKNFNEDLFMKIGVFASILMVTAVSFYLWSPAKTTSAFDWTVTAGSDAYSASLAGNENVLISATPTNTQQVFTADDNLQFSSTCPYAARNKIQSSTTSNSLKREGSELEEDAISATTSPTLDDNSWGYSIDGGVSYYAVPASNANANTIYTSGGITTNQTILIRYGMKINSAIVSGKYSATVTYSLEANESCAKYTLSFDTGGGTEIEDVMLTYGQTVNLADFVSTKEDMELIGWRINNEEWGINATDVNPNPTDALNPTIEAIWKIKQTTFGGITTMLEMTGAACAKEPTPAVTATESTYGHSTDNTKIPTAILTDTRDGSTYTIKKLADGRCWMTENLRISNKTITSDDSDLPAGSTYTIPANNISAFNSTTNLDAAYVHDEYGGYYTYYTATAGWGNSSVPASSTTPKSICPKGWHLPSTSNSEFQNFAAIYNSHALATGAPQVVLDGYIFDRAINSNGARVGFWDGTVDASHDAYLYLLTTAGITIGTNSHLYDGLNLRCIANDTFTITLDANEGTITSDPIIVKHGQRATLPTPTRDDYVFVGWYTEPEGGEKITDEFTDWNDDITLYARWEELMQKFSCDDLEIGESGKLKDSRDLTTYNVMKLLDGRCWMTENLRLVNKTISSADSNLPEETTWTVPASNASTFTFTQNVNSVYYDATYGGYYSYYAATAGAGGTSVALSNVPRDICPKGWRMPLGGEEDEYQTLYNYYNSPSLMMGDPGFVLSGDVNHGQFEAAGINGVYWTGTSYDANYAYRFQISATNANPNQQDDKFTGHAIRCVTENRTIHDVTMMAEVSPKVCENTTTPLVSSTALDWDGSHKGDKTYVPRTVLVDTRDNNRYLISKLSDGNCWMSQNLAFELSTSRTLTNFETDLNTKASFKPQYSTQTSTGGNWTPTGTEGARSYHPPASIAYFRGGNTNASSPTGSGDEYLWEKTGNYYNWIAATAGSGTATMSTTTTNDSICPKGWRLPPDTGNKSFYNLLTELHGYQVSGSGSPLMSSPFNMLMASNFDTDYDVMANTLGTMGHLWSATASSSSTERAFDLHFAPDTVNPHYTNRKGHGFPIRCVARG